MESLKQVLEWYGLSEVESDIYLTGLRYGQLPASSLARILKCSRTTMHSAAKRMVKKWVLQEFKKERTTYFVALNPELLAHRLEEKATIFKKHLPDFMSLVNQQYTKPFVQYFEGIEGIKQLYASTLSSETDIHAFLDTDNIEPSIYRYINEILVPQRVENKTFAKVLVSKSVTDKEYIKNDKNWFRETRVLDNKYFNMSCGIELFDNKIAVMLYHKTDLWGMLIHNKNLYDSLLWMFMAFRELAESK